MLPILIEVGVTPTSLAVFGPPGPPPAAAPVGPPARPAAAPPAVPAAPPAPPPAVPWSPVAPVADWSVPPWSPAASPFELAFDPCWAFTNALLGSRVPQACRTRAEIGMSRSSLYLRRAVPSRRRRRPPTIPLPVTRCMARTTLGIRHHAAPFLAFGYGQRRMGENALLSGLLVLDLAQEPGRTGARILGDLGAHVVRIAAAEDDGSLRALVWDAGKERASEDRLDELLAAAHVVIDTPLEPRAMRIDPARAPHAVWVSVSAFGLEGPRSSWRASDLGVMASSGNMFGT